ncbi:MAG TPA: hypothetical protein VHJ82_06605 [Actinomycetota bacterium]|nr:hypothetical protein [Actinomycetota bacterium]
MSNAELVKDFLRAQNLEQVGDVEAAIGLYEAILDAGFDASGPYDRLIHIYAHRSLHADVVRVASAALASVHTYEDKRTWYETMRERAESAGRRIPAAAPKDPPEPQP